MKALTILFTVLLLAGYGCQSSSGRVLKIDKMKVVLMHQLMAEEFYSNYQFKDTTANKDSLRSVNFAQVLNLHKIDSAQFYKSMQYYKSDPTRFKLLLDSTNAYATREREKRYLLDAALADTLKADTLKADTLKKYQ